MNFLGTKKKPDNACEVLKLPVFSIVLKKHSVQYCPFEPLKKGKVGLNGTEIREIWIIDKEIIKH